MLKNKIYQVGLSFGGAQFIALSNLFFSPPEPIFVPLRIYTLQWMKTNYIAFNIIRGEKNPL